MAGARVRASQMVCWGARLAASMVLGAVVEEEVLAVLLVAVVVAEVEEVMLAATVALAAVVTILVEKAAAARAKELPLVACWGAWLAASGVVVDMMEDDKR
uniref:Uncharacterized protein n=1 Tax=Calcidiscus leptoporus TaxID=127549 RepID=A0A7S0J9H1_9EUKA|mmetsp:Transcript_4650/g.10545  ORF Transcript_4650/g.10545 Transcript_4650/m.10545 type:complete len:101 (+) Transcript_4650:55-357(+)